MSGSRLRWGYASTQDGPYHGDCDTREEAVEEGIAEADAYDPVWVASGHEKPGHAFMPDADYITEWMTDHAFDNGACPEYFDGFRFTKEALAELDAALRAWAEKHVPWAGFWETSGCAPAECVRGGCGEDE